MASRSVAASSLVVLIAYICAGFGLLVVFRESLIADLDAVTAARSADVAAALTIDDPSSLAPALFDTDEQVAAVEVLDGQDSVVRRSRTAPELSSRTTSRSVVTAEGGYTVVVRGSTQAIDTTVRQAAILLIAATGLVLPVAGAATYFFVKRSLRSVEMMRQRVAHISAKHLDRRVPVPATRDEIHSLARTMNDMLDRIESSQTAQRRFVGDASHELRAPLGNILSVLEVIERNPERLDSTLPAALMPEAARMKALVEDLLLLARANEKRLAPGLHTVDVAELVDAEAEQLRSRCAVRVQTDAAGIRTPLDGVAMRRVLRNLLENAAEHARSTVDVSASVVGQHLVLIVADDGPGVRPADFRRRVSIVAEIVAAQRGTLEFEKCATGGARVLVRVPLRQ